MKPLLAAFFSLVLRSFFCTRGQADTLQSQGCERELA